jgi:predicted transcriptional regulator
MAFKDFRRFLKVEIRSADVNVFCLQQWIIQSRREGMKKIVFALLLVLLWTVSSAVAAELKVGDKAPDFKLKDSTGKEYSLDHPQFMGKVLYIAYVDPDEKDTNNHVEDALKKERDSGGLDKDRYIGFGFANLKATNLPNFIIKSLIKSKQEKTGAIVLLDYDYTILNLWGLKNDSSDVVVLDKERICRYVYNGKLPPEELVKMILIIKEYQVK